MAAVVRVGESLPSTARLRLRVAARLTSLACFAAAVAAVPDLTERVAQQGWMLVIVLPLFVVLEYGGARAEHTPHPARTVARKVAPLVLASLAVLALGLLLHPFFATTDYLPTIALGLVGLAMAIGADAIVEDQSRPAALVVARVLAATALLVLVMTGFALLMLAVGYAQIVGLLALAGAIVAYLVAGYVVRRRASR